MESMNRSKATQPPSQPQPFLLHETRYCSEMSRGWPSFCQMICSTTPTVANAQHEPHWPWSLIGVQPTLWQKSYRDGSSPAAASADGPCSTCAAGVKSGVGAGPAYAPWTSTLT